MRDSQRQRLYDAENAVRRQLDFVAAGATKVVVANSTITVPQEVKFGSLEAAQTYVDFVRSTDWFREAFPVAARKPVIVRLRKADSMAHYEVREGKGRIALHEPEHGTGWAWREIVLLHELTHHVVKWWVYQDCASHGPEYAGALLYCLQNAMGPEVGLLLMAAYDDHGVRYEPVANIGA